MDSLVNSILYPNVKVCDLIELSMEDPPVEIKLENGSVIWSKDTPGTKV